MGIRKTEAWILRAGPTSHHEAGELELAEIELDPPSDDEVVVEPLYGSWEANLTHALQRRPVDVCRQRGEPHLVLGNAGVCRVAEVGRGVKAVREGDVCLVVGTAIRSEDRWGYPARVIGFDEPLSMGIMAKRARLHVHNVLRLPERSRFGLRSWAAFPVRYMTAWSNWKVAIASLRAQLDADDLPSPWVWGWGGGTALAELDLARRTGCRCTMIVGDERLHARVRALGIDVVERKTLPSLEFDARRSREDPAYRGEFSRAEASFLELVRGRTNGDGVSIFVDHIGGGSLRATLRALSREGVLTTAGWKAGIETSTVRAIECIGRHVHVHTHAFKASEARVAMEFAESTGWLPDDAWVRRVYAWEDIPTLARDYERGAIDTWFPLFAVNGI